MDGALPYQYDPCLCTWKPESVRKSGQGVLGMKVQVCVCAHVGGSFFNKLEMEPPQMTFGMADSTPFFGQVDKSIWSSGMIPALGAGGPGFKPRNGPTITFLQRAPFFPWDKMEVLDLWKRPQECNITPK